MTKQKLVMIGNGMAGLRTIEEIQSVQIHNLTLGRTLSKL